MRSLLSRSSLLGVVLALALLNSVFAKPSPPAGGASPSAKSSGSASAPKAVPTSFPLTGTWRDSALNEVHIAQGGSHMTMMPKGHVFSGTYALDSFVLTRVFQGSEVKNAPADVQARLIGLKVTVTGTVSADGNTLTGNEHKPNHVTWNDERQVTDIAYGDIAFTLRRDPPLTPAPKATSTAAEPDDQPTKASPKPKSSSAPKSGASASPKPKQTATPKPKKTATPKPKQSATPKPKQSATAKPKPKATTTPKPKSSPAFVPCHPNSGAVASIGPCTGAPGTAMTFKLLRALKSPPAQLVFSTVLQNGVPAHVIVKISGGTPPFYTVSAPPQLCSGANKTWSIRLIDAAGTSQGDIGTFMPDCRNVPNPKRT